MVSYHSQKSIKQSMKITKKKSKHMIIWPKARMNGINLHVGLYIKAPYPFGTPMNDISSSKIIKHSYTEIK